VGSSNPRSVFLESLLVDWEPIEIEFFENMFFGVSRGGEFESEVSFPRNPIGRLGTNRNRIF
jgi:hypothetical protein